MLLKSEVGACESTVLLPTLSPRGQPCLYNRCNKIPLSDTNPASLPVQIIFPRITKFVVVIVVTDLYSSRAITTEYIINTNKTDMLSFFSSPTVIRLNS